MRRKNRGRTILAWFGHFKALSNPILENGNTIIQPPKRSRAPQTTEQRTAKGLLYDRRMSWLQEGPPPKKNMVCAAPGCKKGPAKKGSPLRVGKPKGATQLGALAAHLESSGGALAPPGVTTSERSPCLLCFKPVRVQGLQHQHLNNAYIPALDVCFFQAKKLHNIAATHIPSVDFLSNFAKHVAVFPKQAS